MFISFLGRLIAALPEKAVEGLCAAIGGVVQLTSRGELVRRNRRMALGKSAGKGDSREVFEACERTIELGVLGLAGQFFSPRRWQRTITISPETRQKIETLCALERGILLLIPHTTLMEALTALPLLVKLPAVKISAAQEKSKENLVSPSLQENFVQPKRISVLYRSFASPAIERAILRRRQKHGVQLLDRATGMRRLIHELQAGQIGGLLFDQNSGMKGQLISFMGRVAAASDLPDVVYKYARPIPVILAIKRTGFWRGEVVVEELHEPEVTRDEKREMGHETLHENFQYSLAADKNFSSSESSNKIPTDVPSPVSHLPSPVPLTIQAHRWLENYLRAPDTSTDWLWTHKRWKVLDRPCERFGFGKRAMMELPTQKKTKIFIRMPNWLGDVVMALPMLRALRLGRPDAEITLLCRQGYLPLLQKLVVDSDDTSEAVGSQPIRQAQGLRGVAPQNFSPSLKEGAGGWSNSSIPLADRILGLPKKALDSFRFCASLKHEIPDVTLAFTNSLRGDVEMWLTGARQRFGLRREGYWRPLLSHGYFITKENLAAMHQSHVWAAMFKHFGLTQEVSYARMGLNSPLSTLNSPVSPLGFVPGSANTPEKRYPAEQWRTLAQKLNCPIVLFGTPAETSITSAIAKDLPFVTDLAGKTDMAGLAEALAGCRMVVGNDTGAMHLANALGVPTLVLYGPTSPTRTRPIFEAPYHQLKAPEGEGIGAIKVEEILEKIGCVK